MFWNTPRSGSQAVMKLLLDESVPRRLDQFFPDRFRVSTAPKMGWSGKDNGELLTLAAQASFSALITADQSMAYQQNLQTLPIAMIVLIAHQNRIEDFSPLVPSIVELLDAGIAKRVYRISAQ